METLAVNPGQEPLHFEDRLRRAGIGPMEGLTPGFGVVDGLRGLLYLAGTVWIQGGTP